MLSLEEVKMEELTSNVVDHALSSGASYADIRIQRKFNTVIDVLNGETTNCIEARVSE
jgi:predicted Zn-dependent protease